VTPVAILHARSLLRGRASTVALVGFALGAVVVVLLGLTSFRQLGLRTIGPGTAALLNLSLLLPTALAIVMAAGTVASGQESGFLAMIRARRLPASAVVVGLWLAVVTAACVTLAAGFGAASLVLAGNVSAEDLLVFGALFGDSAAAVAASASIGILLGVLVRTRLQATLLALGVWFILAVGLDLVIIALGVFLAAGEPALLVAAIANPVQSARLLGLLLLDADAAGVGPLATYLGAQLGPTAAQALLVGTLAAWTVVPLALASHALRRRDL